MTTVLIPGVFDNLQGRDVRFFEEAARLGPVRVLLWEDPSARFPLAERRYLLESLRFIDRVEVTGADPLAGRHAPEEEGVWTWPEWDEPPGRVEFCRAAGLPYHVIPSAQVAGFPYPPEPANLAPGRKKVIVTGCFDWLHSGHVRFFEEASAYGDLYVAVGSDANVRLLKGEGHPLFPQEQRRYQASAVRFVTRALVASGSGWMDAAPDIDRIRPDIYLVNEDGDKPEKRAFCAERGLEYVVLARRPAPGLPPRSSTVLRGF